MAKISNVRVKDIPEYVDVSKNKTNILTVITEITFHPLDVKLEMEYQLYLFVYDIHGEKEDIPILISNWDDSKMERISKQKQEDDFISKGSFLIKSIDNNNNQLVVEKQMTLRLGKMTETTSVFSRNFEVFATLIPAINRASARSTVFESKLIFP
jgi:flagellar motor component MotA